MVQLVGAASALDRVVLGHLASGGRRSRARLALAACDELGAERGDAVHWAAACELLHNATLIHDDLQDGDERRRGQATLWFEHGMPQAINAGDLLLMLPFAALEGIGDEALAFRLTRAVTRRARSCVQGQALEQRLAAEGAFEAELYDRAVKGKSGELLALPVEGAALLAGHSADQARELAAPLLEVGLLYQLVDDLVDLFGDKGRGQRGNDLREGKPSALVVEHLRRRPGDLALRAVLASPREQVTDEQVARSQQALVASGAAEAVLARARSLGAGLAPPHHPLFELLGAFSQLCLAPLEYLEFPA